MSIKERLLKKQEELTNKITKAKIESLQQQDERKRKKEKFVEKGTIRYGLLYRQNPFDLMKDVIERRRDRREGR